MYGHRYNDICEGTCVEVQSLKLLAQRLTREGAESSQKQPKAADRVILVARSSDYGLRSLAQIQTAASAFEGI